MQNVSNRCVFCEIAAARAPASFVYQDPKLMAPMDARPASLGYTLVAPKEHWRNILEVPAALDMQIFALVQDMARAINEAFQPAGLNIVQNNGRAALQSVPHLHVHLIPRYAGNELSDVLTALISRRRREMPSRDSLDGTAKKIAERLRHSQTFA